MAKEPGTKEMRSRIVAAVKTLRERTIRGHIVVMAMNAGNRNDNIDMQEPQTRREARSERRNKRSNERRNLLE